MAEITRLRLDRDRVQGLLEGLLDHIDKQDCDQTLIEAETRAASMVSASRDQGSAAAAPPGGDAANSAAPKRGDPIDAIMSRIAGTLQRRARSAAGGPPDAPPDAHTDRMGAGENRIDGLLDRLAEQVQSLNAAAGDGASDSDGDYDRDRRAGGGGRQHGKSRRRRRLAAAPGRGSRRRRRCR